MFLECCFQVDTIAACCGQTERVEALPTVVGGNRHIRIGRSIFINKEEVTGYERQIQILGSTQKIAECVT